MFSKIRNAAVATTIGAAAITSGASAQAVQWRVEDGGNGHWYQFVPNIVITWEGARLAAIASGGYLATLASPSENEFAFNLVSQSAQAWSGPWGPFLGATRRELPGWQWVTGEPFQYTAWGPGEPNNDSGGSGPEDRLAMLNHPSGPAKWNDVTDSGCAGPNCDGRTSSGYLTEWSADCNGDGIVDYGQIRAGQLADANGNNTPDCCEQGTNCDSLDGGLEAHYTFEGNCLDSSGNGRNGAATSVGYVAGPAGLAGSAAFFDGVSSFVQIQGVPIPTNNAFSWSLWLRADAIGQIPVIERIEAIGNNLMSPSLFIRSNGAIGFGSYSFASGGISVETAAQTVTPGSWIHIACTSAVSGVRRVYIDGALLGEIVSADYGQPLSLIVLGRDRVDCCTPFKGAIDDLRIYNRPLSASEVATLYAAGAACVGDILVDRIVNGADLGALLSYWGPVTSSPVSQACDLNRDNTVDGFDLALLLGNWGICGN